MRGASSSYKRFIQKTLKVKSITDRYLKNKYD